MPSKRADYLSLIEALQDRDVPIDGVGHQAHVDFARPVQWLDDSLTAVEQLDGDLLQAITELDVSNSKENNGADVSAGTVAQHSAAMTAGEAETEVGYYYRDLFDMLETHAESLESVTFWGVSNARSWLRTWPAARPWEAPLPFDDDLQATPAYWGMVDPTKLAARPADVLPPRIAGQDDLRALATDLTGAAVSYPLPSAIDTQAGPVTPECTPAPGSLFPVGTTTVTCTAVDPSGNKARPADFDVTVVESADVRVAVDGPARVRTGKPAEFTVTVTNVGPFAARDVAAVLTTSGLAEPVGSHAGAAGAVTIGDKTMTGTRWELPTLAAGASATFTVTGTVSARVGAVTAVAGASSAVADPILGNNHGPTTVSKVAR